MLLDFDLVKSTVNGLRLFGGDGVARRVQPSWSVVKLGNRQSQEERLSAALKKETHENLEN